MENKVIPPEMEESTIKWFFDQVVNDDWFYPEAFKNKLKDMGYENSETTFTRSSITEIIS